MTAAHCADGVFHHEVVIGAHEIRDPNNKIIDAYSPTVHPDWDSYNLANDLAILKLDTPIDFSTEPNVGPNCLASSGDYTDQMSLVSTLDLFYKQRSSKRLVYDFLNFDSRCLVLLLR